MVYSVDCAIVRMLFDDPDAAYDVLRGARFQVSEASVYRWLKPGGLTYQRPGPRRPHKLDWEQVRRHVEAHPDQTQAERARHFHVSRHGIWYALQRLQITHKKKDRVPRTRSAAT